VVFDTLCRSSWSFCSGDIDPPTVKRKRPNVSHGVLNPQYSCLFKVGCVLGHVQPIRRSALAGPIELGAVGW